jgi:hypothetical protein
MLNSWQTWLNRLQMKHLARKQYTSCSYCIYYKWCNKVRFWKYRNIRLFLKKTYWMFILIHQEILGQYYIAFSCTYLDIWLKTIQEWAGNKKTKICFEKDKKPSQIKTRKWMRGAYVIFTSSLTSRRVSKSIYYEIDAQVERLIVEFQERNKKN